MIEAEIGVLDIVMETKVKKKRKKTNELSIIELWGNFRQLRYVKLMSQEREEGQKNYLKK